MIRWWDLRSRSVVQEQIVQGEIGSCEFTNVRGEPTDIGGGLPVLTIAAGRTVYFYGGITARNLLKTVVLPYDVASAALHPSQRKFVTGGMKDTWAKVYDYDSEQELGKSDFSSPHCEANKFQIFTRVITAPSGASVSPQMESFMQLEARMGRSRCGRIAMVPTDCGKQNENKWG